MIDSDDIRLNEVNACLLCGEDGRPLHQRLRDWLFGAPGEWNLVRCPRCGLAWLNPRPTASDISRSYESYYTHQVLGRDRWAANVRTALRNAVLQSHFGYKKLENGAIRRGLGKVLGIVGPIRERAELSVMTLHALPTGRLLDVGCGNGRFLVKMRALGWDVVGVEPDPAAASIARERYALGVYQGALEEAGLPNESFDAITMSHVIEHLSDPVTTLRECRRLLKPSGRLVVITPNIRSLGSRLLGEAWRGLEPPRHLYLFSRSTLPVLFEHAGLDILHVRSTARIARSIWMASRLLQRHGRAQGPTRRWEDQGSWVRLEALTFVAIEYFLTILVDVGEELVLIAKR